MLTRWLLYPYAHTLYCTKYHKIPVNGYVCHAAKVLFWTAGGRAGARAWSSAA